MKSGLPMREQRFLKRWKKTRVRGFYRYVATCGLGGAVGAVLGVLALNWPLNAQAVTLICCGFLGGLLGGLLNWRFSEARYGRLSKQKLPAKPKRKKR